MLAHMDKHLTTLRAIFRKPVRPIRYGDVESLFLSLGFAMTEGAGSRVRFVSPKKEVFALHRPHPGNELGKDAVRGIRRFLESVGIAP